MLSSLHSAKLDCGWGSQSTARRNHRTFKPRINCPELWKNDCVVRFPVTIPCRLCLPFSHACAYSLRVCKPLYGLWLLPQMVEPELESPWQYLFLRFLDICLCILIAGKIHLWSGRYHDPCITWKLFCSGSSEKHHVSNWNLPLGLYSDGGYQIPAVET